jgi:class III poly(R)-hydroxyalkanoic acid synthase PhaE subunit
LWLEHGEALKNYAGALSRIVVRAGELLREKMAERAAAGESFESLRACYDLWVDCGEEAYAEIASSSDFSRLQAGLTNSLMAVKRQEQKMVDEALGALNMPTRRELDTSHRRLHGLQRQVWRMQQSLNDAGVRELREEVATLEARLQNMAADAETPVAASRRAAKPKNPV